MAAALLCGGCHAIPLAAIGAAGAVGGWLAASQTTVQAADTGLALIKPINQALCTVEQAKPHTPAVTAALGAFCAHLPSDIVGILVQAAAIYVAIKDERTARAP